MPIRQKLIGLACKVTGSLVGNGRLVRYHFPQRHGFILNGFTVNGQGVRDEQ